MARNIESKLGETGSLGISSSSSVYGMTLLDFQRLHTLSCQIEMFGCQYESGDFSYMRPYFVAMKRFYLNIRHMVVDRVKVDAAFDEAEESIDGFENRMTPYSVRPLFLVNCKKNLKNITNIYYETKQRCGLGLVIQKNLSDKKKWDRALKIGEG